MKKILLLVGMTILAQVCYGKNYEVVRNASSLSSYLNCGSRRMAVVLFYSSAEPCNHEQYNLQRECDSVCSWGDKKTECRKARQDLVIDRKQFKIDWAHKMRCLEKMFRCASQNRPEILFVAVDISRNNNRHLAKEYKVSQDRPEYILFKDGKPTSKRKYLNLDKLSESSLFTFVTSGFGDYLKNQKVSCVRTEEMFEPAPIHSYSVWDWGGPFYRDALFPYSGTYYMSMLA
ncbi:hypothetical protein HOM50_05425 [bacterium]|jgi:hypothetical protein|nr:hypothetical protein [bacterium]MBT5015820.1 hypothetical protein [bacterium]